MNRWYFIVPIAAVSYILALAAGYLAGYFHRRLVDGFAKLSGRVGDLEDELNDNSSAVVDTTPQLYDAKRRAGKLPENDEESAIVTVKSPRQIQNEKDAQLKEDLDQASGRSSR